LRDELGVGATNVALDKLKKKQKLDDTCYSGDDSKNNKALRKRNLHQSSSWWRGPKRELVKSKK